VGAQPDGLPWPADNRLGAEPSDAASFHAYLHIPFCVTRCGYCDFNTYTASELPGVDRNSFHTTLAAEIAWSEEVLSLNNLPKRKVATVFFGGGTPSLLQPAQIECLLNELASRFGLEPNAEITMEANPDDMNYERLAAFSGVGVNRISFGVQSFDQAVLATLERSHDANAVPQVISDAARLGIRASVDLIFGAPGESLSSWRRTVRTAATLPIEHISAYALIVEPGTRLHRQIRSGELVPQEDDFLAEKYWLADELLGQAGYSWYEVSNFTRGKPSLHNLAYWNSQDWWGYGPGAHSHISGNRWWNTKHPSRYAEQLRQGSPAAGYEQLSGEQRDSERVLLGLRLRSGMLAAELIELGVAERSIGAEIAAGNLQQSGDRVSLASRSRFLADGIILRLLEGATA
jgi:oxygen-independent coproporphyrinogen-3 oxidase